MTLLRVCFEGAAVNWIDAADLYYQRIIPHDSRLSALPTEWQREVVALYLLDTGVNWGGYLTFFVNRGREAYRYATQALRRIGATRTAKIIEKCQALIDEHAPPGGDPRRLLPNEVIRADGTTVKKPGSTLPDSILQRLSELSDEYLQYPENVGDLAAQLYGPLVVADKPVR
jgi:hypothetical protein